jgi:hypothetical protein
MRNYCCQCTGSFQDLNNLMAQSYRSWAEYYDQESDGNTVMQLSHDAHQRRFTVVLFWSLNHFSWENLRLLF